MRKTVKAVLFSALIFPGTGHFTLGRYKRGLLFFIPALLGLLILVYAAIDKAQTLAAQIGQGQVPLDAVALSDLVLSSTGENELLVLNIATWLLIICWIAGMIDSFRVGKAADRAAKP